VAQVAPIHAPIELPARRFTTTNQYGVRLSIGTAASRAGNEVRTTIRDIALFMITACRARNPEPSDQQRQSEHGAAKADEPAENADTAPAANAAGSDLGRDGSVVTESVVPSADRVTVSPLHPGALSEVRRCGWTLPVA
jgi:hypothetical protein